VFPVTKTVELNEKKMINLLFTVIALHVHCTHTTFVNIIIILICIIYTHAHERRARRYFNLSELHVCYLSIYTTTTFIHDFVYDSKHIIVDTGTENNSIKVLTNTKIIHIMLAIRRRKNIGKKIHIIYDTLVSEQSLTGREKSNSTTR
jgi:hypothetical protein